MLSNNPIFQKQRIYAPIIVGITLFVIVFVLYPIYTKYVDAKTQIATLEKTQSEKQKKIDEIKSIQSLFAGSGSSELKTKIQKYNHPLDSSMIMETIMLNKYTQSTPLTPGAIRIGAISVDKWKKLPSGLSIASTSINVSADTPDQLIDFITYLTTESNLAFTIDSINLPLDTGTAPANNNGISLSLSLGVYYFE